MRIAAGQFKATCLKLMDEVNQAHMEIIITKRGKAIAKLVPVKDPGKNSLFGFLKNSVAIRGDIVRPTGEKWDATT